MIASPLGYLVSGSIETELIEANPLPDIPSE